VIAAVKNQWEPRLVRQPLDQAGGWEMTNS
jgi:hypothetical protein